MPRKIFTAGEVLAAADVNTFLMDQTVMSFAGTAARGSAIGTAVEGMVTYLADSDSFEFWNGSAYTPLAEGSGKILQVVQETHSTSVGNSTTTYADTGLSATITPTSATSKVLVLVTQGGQKTAGNSGNSFDTRLVRGATQLFQQLSYFYTGTAIDFYGVMPLQYLDSPATTSATTYKTQFKNGVAASQAVAQPNNQPSFITLMEVSA
jgi:hypothetical protein